eukprot:766195-Hanusia_phi.AAC.15
MNSSFVTPTRNKYQRPYSDEDADCLAAQGAPAAKAAKAAKAVKEGLRSKKPTKVRRNTTFHRPKTLKKPRAPKYLRKSAPKANKLDQFQIIK